MAFNLYHCILVTMLLVCGSINTLTTKWADVTKACGLADNCDHANPNKQFDHPFVQCVTMFIGEFLCFLFYWIWKCISPDSHEVTSVHPCKWFLFIPPAILDMIGTTTLYIGLNLTYASSFQMLRGAVVVFTGLLSVAFLGRSIRVFMWVGITTLTVGLIVIGVADVLFTSVDTDANGIVSGDLLIILAQIVAAVQFVYEEKYLKKHSVPALLAVGLEGMFGAIILTVLLVPFYYIPAGRPFSNNPSHRLEDVWHAFAQMHQNGFIVLATVGAILSIAVYNFSGISITKVMSATTRQVVDVGRTLVVWAVSLGVGWQTFEYRSFLLQLVGFLLLILGIFIYNDLIFRPLLIRYNFLKPSQKPGEDEDDRELSPPNDDDLLIVHNDDERLLAGH